MTIRRATGDDDAAIARLYAPYVTGSAVSFETAAPDPAEMRRRIKAGGDLHPWLVACDGDGRLLGFAASSAYRPRAAYRFTVETSIYLSPAAAGRGLGGLLYSALIDTLTRQGFTQAIGAISLPNPASVRLHEALGFGEAGLYRDVGFKLGRWRSVGLWQRALAPMSEQPDDPLPVSAVWRDREIGEPA